MAARRNRFAGSEKSSDVRFEYRYKKLTFEQYADSFLFFDLVEPMQTGLFSSPYTVFSLERARYTFCSDDEFVADYSRQRCRKCGRPVVPAACRDMLAEFSAASAELAAVCQAMCPIYVFGRRDSARELSLEKRLESIQVESFRRESEAGANIRAYTEKILRDVMSDWKFRRADAAFYTHVTIEREGDGSGLFPPRLSWGRLFCSGCSEKETYYDEEARRDGADELDQV